MGVGDKIVLVERVHPRWTIERIQEFFHRDSGNLEMLLEVRNSFLFLFFSGAGCSLSWECES